MTATEKFDQVEIAAPEELWVWLALHHGHADSVWLVTWKKDSRDKYVSREDVLDALVAHGWIDGIRRKRQDGRTMQLISPRKQQAWAQSYKDRAARLIQEGRMHPAGLRSVEAGRTSGLWDFYADVDALIVPDDLAVALGQAGADMLQAWDALPRAYRRNVLRWIKTARTNPTRAKRIAEAARSTAEARRLPQM